MPQTEIFGHFSGNIPGQTEYLLIGFSPSSIPLKQRWRTNGLSADFIADYLQTFFTGQGDGNGVKISEAPIPMQSRNAVKYIANELLENAMKFHDEVKNYCQTQITFYLCGSKLVFQVHNTVHEEGKRKFVRFIEKLLASDPHEMYIEQMEANAREDGSHHSGLGFLSMVCDYSAKLGWKFEKVSEDPPLYRVTTMVTLDV